MSRNRRYAGTEDNTGTTDDSLGLEKGRGSHVRLTAVRGDQTHVVPFTVATLLDFHRTAAPSATGHTQIEALVAAQRVGINILEVWVNQWQLSSRLRSRCLRNSRISSQLRPVSVQAGVSSGRCVWTWVDLGDVRHQGYNLKELVGPEAAFHQVSLGCDSWRAHRIPYFKLIREQAHLYRRESENQHEKTLRSWIPLITS